MKKIAVMIFLFFFSSFVFSKTVDKQFFIHHWITKTGIPVYFIERPHLHFIDIAAVFRAGSAYDTVPGVANLTSHLLLTSTEKLSSVALAQAADFHGANLTQTADRDHIAIQLRALTDNNLMPSVDLFSEVLSKPAFSEEELIKTKNNVLSSIKMREESPDEWALEQFFEAVYKNHPYAHDPLGDEKSIQSIQRKDIVDFYRRFFNSHNLSWVLAGDLSIKQAEAITEKLSETLPAGEPAPRLPMVKTLKSPVLLNFTRPLSQTTVIVGQDGLTRHYPGMMALRLANHMLGVVPLDSLLFRKLRKEKGLVYTVNSQLLPLEYGGVFFVMLKTKNLSREEAIQAVKTVLLDFEEKPIDKTLFDSAKRHLDDGFPVMLYSNKSLVGNLINVAFYHQPLNYLETFTQKIREITPKMAQDAFKNQIDPEKLVIVSLGGSVQ